MHKRLKMMAAVAILTALFVPASVAGENATGQTADLVAAWEDVSGKVLAMAEDFPEAKYDYRPTPGVRTFAEQLLHVAGSTHFFINLAKGGKPGEEDLSREKYKTKADIVAAVKKAIAEGEAFFRESSDG
ncbi:MAG: DinB family protein, partial [Nevskiales bacterium]